MGIFKLIRNLNNADGIREAMRLSYRKHHRLAASQPQTDSPPHHVGLFGAMGSRMRVNGQTPTEHDIWIELLPFLLIEDEENASEALAEYAVYVERTVDTKLVGLKEAVNGALRRASVDNPYFQIATTPLVRHLRWYGLLEQDVKQRLATVAVDWSQE